MKCWILAGASVVLLGSPARAQAPTVTGIFPPGGQAGSAPAVTATGANLDGGMSITYDVTYPVTRRLSVGANVSYASRSRRPGWFGGGLATSVEF